MQNKISNVITIDVEDWEQSSWDVGTPISDRVVRNTAKVIDILDRYACKATFFVLGKVAEQKPEVVRMIVGAGHEVASHGYGHIPVFKQTREEFRADLQKSREVIEPYLSQPMTAYRAPDFSILLRNRWALDVLLEEGFTVDSSLFPMWTGRYGIPNIPVEPHYIETLNGNKILEIPVSVLKIGFVRIPIGGGGYFRLFPQQFIIYSVASINANVSPVILYFHPYEFTPDEMKEQMHEIKKKVPFLYRIHQGLGRQKLLATLEEILSQNYFVTLGEMVEKLPVTMTNRL
jgi:polysaccharide deacetylase family protein (PEP-CTERM system associated)